MTSFLNSITKRKKTPEQLVASACTSLDTIQLGENAAADDNLCKRLGKMKTILYGDGKATDIDEDKVCELASKIISVSRCPESPLNFYATINKLTYIYRKICF